MAINKKILIIDDDTVLARIIQRQIAKFDYESDFCGSAEEAVTILTRDPALYQLILLDIILPGMNGLEALPVIHNISRSPVIMMTADRDSKFLERAFAEGAVDYLVKPFEMTELVWRIKSHLERIENKEKLIISEENYKSLFNSIHEGMVMTDENLNIVNYNPAVLEILQVPGADLTGKSVMDNSFSVIDEDGRTITAEEHPAFISLNKNTSCYDMVVGMTRPEHSIWVSVNTVPLLKKGQSSPSGVVISFRDITLLKSARDDLLNERLIYTGGPVVIFKWGRIDWQVEYVSDNVETQLGYARGMFLDNTLSYRDLIHPEDLEHFEKTIQEKSAVTDWLEVEYRLKNSANKYIWVRVYMRIFKLGKLITHYHGYIININESKFIEEKLKEREGELSEAQRIAHLGNWSLDLNTRTLQWSDEIFRIFKLDPLTVEKISFEFFLEKVFPEDREIILAELEKLLTEGESEGIEHRILLPDGSVRFVMEKGELIKDKYDGKVKIIGIIQDITESRQAKEELLESRLRNNAILENITDAVVITSEDGTLINFYPGAERIFGYKEKEVINKSVFTLFADQDYKSYSSFLEKKLHDINEQGSWKVIQAKRQDGAIFPAEISISEWELNNKMYYTIIIRDISERKRTEEILRQTAKMESLGHLTGGIAHDFNNLLGIITGNLDLLSRMGNHDEKITKRINTAQKASSRAADLTRKLLAYSRKQPSGSEIININDVLNDMHDIMQSTTGKNIQIEFELGGDIRQVKTDKSEFENTLLNLLINAKDAMPDGGRVTMRTRNREMEAFSGIMDTSPAGNYVELSVKDTGSGIPAEILEKIFDPFFTTKAVGKGTGLGLSIAYSFIKNMSGNLVIHSEPGKGTEFVFYLPALKEETVPEKKVTIEHNEPGGKETIIVLDDEEDLAEIAGQILQDKGYTVYKFSRPDDVIDFLEKGNHADLVFSDIVMPGETDGLQLARKIESKWPAVKLLLTSGYPQKAASGADFRDISFPLLVKPYKNEELLHFVRNLLD